MAWINAPALLRHSWYSYSGSESATIPAPARAGRSGRLRQAGLTVEVRQTGAMGDATRITREAYATGTRHFIAFGGDGTCCEVLNAPTPSWPCQSP